MNIKEVLLHVTKQLKPYIPRAAKEAQLLLMHHLKKDELFLLTNPTLHVEDFDILKSMVQRRANQEPLEYITNKVSFYSKEFYIDKGALIPRPETELLIDEVKKKINKDAKITFVEVGVGSGVISIILAKHFKNATFVATDISKEALKVAKTNIEKFALQDKIELRLGSLLDMVDEDIDVLVSNPPYIQNGVRLDKNLSYEPQNALFGGESGDEIIKELIDEVFRRDIGLFACEMGYDQKEKVSSYLQDKKYKNLNFYKDLSGFDRGFMLEL